MINLFTIAEALSEVDAITLKEELLFFASNYHQLKQSLFPSNDDNLSDLSDYSVIVMMRKMAKIRLSCAFSLFSQYKFCSTAYENLFPAYECLVTLSVTRCSCERSFSKLKRVKTRLRLSLTQEKLESLMFIALKNNKDKIIDKFATSSKELSSLLLL